MRQLLLLITMVSSFAHANHGGPLPVNLDINDLEDTGQLRGHSFGYTPNDLCSKEVLHNGVQLPHMPELYRYWYSDRIWGTPEMIQAIVTATEEMAWRLPHVGPPIVGDISRRHGGYLHGHRSHRSGIDADISIFVANSEGRHSSGFQHTTPQTMDYEANWLFWKSLLDTGLVERVFLDQSLIDAMRKYLIENQLLTEEEALAVFPRRGTQGLWSRTGVFQHVSGHRNHIHLRVVCGDL